VGAKRADQQGYENLRKPEIAAAVAEGQRRQLNKAELGATRVLEELGRLSFSDIGNVLQTMTVKQFQDLPPDVRATVASVKVTKKNLTARDGHQENVVEFKLWDKPRALEMLAK